MAGYSWGPNGNRTAVTDIFGTLAAGDIAHDALRKCVPGTLKEE